MYVVHSKDELADIVKGSRRFQFLSFKHSYFTVLFTYLTFEISQLKWKNIFCGVVADLERDYPVQFVEGKVIRFIERKI